MDTVMDPYDTHTKFNFDFQLSDNYHLRFFWSNELHMLVRA